MLGTNMMGTVPLGTASGTVSVPIPPASDGSYLIPGIDLLAVACISKADVAQAISNAKPQEGIGFVIVGDSSPDVTQAPELARFLWLETTLGVPTGDIFYYDGNSWESIITFSGQDILDGTITLDKLSVVGAAPYSIIQVNSLGTDYQFISLINAIQNKSIPLDKLVGGTVGNKVFVSLTDVNSFLNISDLPNYFADNTFPISKLVRGAVSNKGRFLFTSPDALSTSWEIFDPNTQILEGELALSRLNPTGFAANALIGRNATNTQWEQKTLVNTQPSNAYATNNIVGVTQDVVITKIANKTWLDFEITYTGSFRNTAVGNVSVVFTYRTNPEMDVVVTNGAGSGCGNSGQSFIVNNSDDAISPSWTFKGQIPASLISTDSVTIRATITMVNMIQESGVFLAAAKYI